MWHTLDIRVRGVNMWHPTGRLEGELMSWMVPPCHILLLSLVHPFMDLISDCPPYRSLTVLQDKENMLHTNLHASFYF